jgi:putative endonuclease
VDNKTFGKIGEDMAERFLRRRGYKIISRNWRCALGEIDIVAQEKEFTVFVEIKARRSGSFGLGYFSVNWAKQLKLIKVAHVYMKRYGLTEQPCRVDIVSIDMADGQKAMNIELIKDAFWEK